ncbi:MAG: hypothetical protein IT232_04425 [Flavobacteriales bacterium]|nr:hypothetical protein [Flavobacteriales bacterium]
MIIGIILYVAIIVFMIASMWKIYTKAGQPGWACIVPIYNLIILLKIVNKPLWWIVLLLIPIVNFIALIIIINALSKAFGKGVGFTLGLLFLSFIFYPILGFGDAQYQGQPAA